MSTEIKVGQIWESTAAGYRVKIEWADGRQVLSRRSADADSRPELLDADYFRRVFRPYAEPSPRYITEADIRKMLAVNPVLFARRKARTEGEICYWHLCVMPMKEIEDNDDVIERYEYSHNPFAPNPKIVGPEIEVVE